MKTIWQSLAWREWHEHKWKLVAITAILWGVTLIILWGMNSKEHLLDAIVPLTSLCMVPLAVFVGLGSAASERARGSFAFTQSLPINPWGVAVSKLIAGSITVAVPIALTFTLAYCISLFRDAGKELYGFGALGPDGLVAALFVISIALSFYIWSAATGVNRKDEISAGAVAISAIVGWYLLVTIVWYLLVGQFSGRTLSQAERFLMALAAAATPGGFALTSTDARFAGFGLVSLAVSLMVHAGLVALYLGRYGQTANLEIASRSTVVPEAPEKAWLGPARQSIVGAIAWKQFRESLPLVLVGFAGVVGFVAITVSVGGLRYGTLAQDFAQLFAVTSGVIGLFVAMVVGIGVCLNDVSPGINTFWRSRPINPNVWFWTKFFTGLAVLLASVYVPLFTVLVLVHPDPATLIIDASSLLMPLVQGAVFAAAVMTMCLVRHAVYAAILSMASVYLGVLCGLGLWYAAGLMGWVRLYPHGWMEPEDSLPVALGMILSAVVSTAIAWLAVRNDWGWKSRY